jgi:hypothetical protein
MQRPREMADLCDWLHDRRIDALARKLYARSARSRR